MFNKLLSVTFFVLFMSSLSHAATSFVAPNSEKNEGVTICKKVAYDKLLDFAVDFVMDTNSGLAINGDSL